MKLRLTNKLGLPEPIVRAIENDSYDAKGSHYTPTSLLKPPRMGELARTVGYEEDASDRIAALHGQAMHTVLERAAKGLRDSGFIVEERFTQPFTVDGNEYNVSAQIDLYDEKNLILSDYKTALVSHVKYGLKDDHRLQLNLQAYLLRQAGFRVDKAEVVLFLKDWTPMRDYPGYPESATVKFEVPLMLGVDIVDWVESRIRLHEEAKVTLPLCTQEEKWNRPTYAVMKATAMRATKVFDTKEEAEEFLKTKKPDEGYIIKERGDNLRCKFYCPVRFVCQQARDEGSIVIQDGDELKQVK